MLRPLPVVVAAPPGRPEPDPDHPMGRVTRQIAFEPTGWTPERAAKVAELFDGMAPEWHERLVESRFDAFDDALARGGPFVEGPVLELGSGVGLFTDRLRTAAALGAGGATVISVDLSLEMLRHADPSHLRVQGDGSSLPFPDASFSVAVLVNMFLFPAEMTRLLGSTGALVWVNTYGPATPINLSAEEVIRAMPEGWHGVHSDAGWGWWTVLRPA